MALTTPERNPFMLLVQPEVVLAAIEKSERLGSLNRHLCRPLDRPAPTSVRPAGELETDLEDASVEAAEEPGADLA